MEGKLIKEAAKKMVLDRNGCVHVFKNLPFGLIGADWKTDEVMEQIDKSFECALAGEQATAMNHSLVIFPSENCKQSDLLFVETITEAVAEVEEAEDKE